MQFCEVCEHDNHRETILNLAHSLYIAREEEMLKAQMAREAYEKRARIEDDIIEIVRIVCERNTEIMPMMNGVHSKDEKGM